EDLHRRVIHHKGLSFAGLEGSIKYNEGKIQYNDRDMALMIAGMAPQMGFQRLNQGHGLDVLVTHSPPRGIHDAEDRPHQGFKSMLQFMRWYRPRFMLHGHVHTYDRRKTTQTNYLDTLIININPVLVLDVEPLK
ncbi:MAG TPA: hypothetical protein VHL11_08210, partial [Phototrophicaceae bacterium]|nr:hypothetical protein [Phototrophicaceae bacterium]